MSVPCIDAHQHFWRLARGDYAWLTPAAGPLFRDFEPGDLAPELARAGVDGTLVVQAAPSTAETRHLLALAAVTPWVLGVVGWIDFVAPGAAAELDELARDPQLVGLRPMLQDLADERWILRAEARPVLHELERRGLVFEALVRPHQLGALCELVERQPGLRVVVDHGAKPAIREGPGWAGRTRWREQMRRLARAGCHVKLSGLASEARPGAADEELRPWIDVLLEDFGPARVLWGSDWPVLLGTSSYAGWLELCRRALAGLAPAERAAVLGGNALACYGLERSRAGRTR